LKSIRNFDELCRDADASPRFANTPFKNMFNIESPAEFRQIDIFALEKEALRRNLMNRKQA